jgi:HAD superfamily hydrolase (TIGR01484 family)
MSTNKELIIFDLDNTLAISKTALDDEMAGLLRRLLLKMKVAIISGGMFSQFELQVLDKLSSETVKFENLYLLPTSGTRLYIWQGAWQVQYADNLSESDKKKIIESLNSALKITGFNFSEKSYGERIEDRESEIAFSALGQKAPPELKAVWDPTREKRERIVLVLKEMIPDFDIHLGGGTTIDITKKGEDKAYGIRKLAEFLHMPIEKMIFVGDALYPEGNDYPAISTGVECVSVSGPEETKKVISDLLK